MLQLDALRKNKQTGNGFNVASKATLEVYNEWNTEPSIK